MRGESIWCISSPGTSRSSQSWYSLRRDSADPVAPAERPRDGRFIELQRRAPREPGAGSGGSAKEGKWMEALGSRYRQAFPGRHAVLPVVHVDSLQQAQRNVRIAREAGADGVFLINHGMADEVLLDIHTAVADRQTGWWVGVNCLGMSPEVVFGAISRKIN